MRDDRIDAYIEKAAPFARPILGQLRDWIHAACPEAEETMRWSSPSFTYKGRILAGMAAFKAHASFGFWQGEAAAGEKGEGAMGQLGRLTSLADLPDEAAFRAMVEKAMALGETGAKRPAKHVPRAAIAMPDDFNDAIEIAPAAAATWAGFPPGKRHDYLEWVTEAKRPDTRAKRIAQSVEWLAEGKARHWKYEKC